MKKIYDTHCHINMEPLNEDIESIYQECKARNVYANIIGVDVASSKQAIEIAKKYQDIFRPTVAIHPNDVETLSFNEIDSIINQLEQLIEENKGFVIAVGETGLDRYYNKEQEALERQLYALERHIALAEKYQLPVIFHIRDAHDEMIEFMSKRKINTTVIIHCFSGNALIAKKYLEYGCYISYSGVITFKNAIELQESLNVVDKDKILCETDAPFLAPVPFRGKTCFPWYTENNVDKVSELLGKDISDQIFENSCKAFNIKWS